ncbi:hypothetical protein E2320_003740 [Naja naja]|nr:hypothetical protein E2320_003740 [Naja naja]
MGHGTKAKIVCDVSFKVWLTLADHYLKSIAIDWDKTMRFTFNDRSNPDDDSMGIQIVKVLKSLLICLLNSLQLIFYLHHVFLFYFQIMIYLIDKVLPDSYFVNNLKALSVDMAVFRDLLRMKLPELSQNLDTLQRAANKESGGGYEPPLTNVFTMQWFLTLFATCLPNHTVLKIWDSVFFEGSEIILRVALAIWAKLEEQINSCETADDFYGTMGKLTQEMLEDKLIDSNELMQMVYSMAQFPFPQLSELREKYTYNITPFPAAVKSTASRLGKIKDSDEENEIDDEDSIANVIGCLGPFSGFLAPELQKYQKHFKDHNQEPSLGSSNIAELSPGAINACRSEYHAAFNSMMMERMTTDINALKRQYSRIKKKQQQQVHHVYITAGYEDDDLGIVLDPRDQLNNDKGPVTSLMPSQVNHSPVINHLLLGKKIKQTSKSAKNHVPSHTGGKILAGPPHEDIKAKLNSPWRTHMRVHRKNIARAKGHLGYGDTIGLIEEHNECGKASSINAKEETANESKTMGGDGNISTEGQSPEPTYKDNDSSVYISVVQQKLETLELAQNSRDGSEDETHNSELPSLANDSGVVAKSCTAKPQVFCPFPSVKPLRKSAAARNLGLYGPNERTPTVHFPQMSRSFNKPTSGNSGSKKR